jgi:hypothetical protein
MEGGVYQRGGERTGAGRLRKGLKGWKGRGTKQEKSEVRNEDGGKGRYAEEEEIKGSEADTGETEPLCEDGQRWDVHEDERRP